MSIFEKASRQKLRFKGVQGNLSVEDLWDLPITSRTKTSLNGLFQTVSEALKSESEVSLIAQPSKKASDDKLRLEIITHIFHVRQSEAQAASDKQELLKQRDALMNIKLRKEQEAQESLSMEELDQQLAELNSKLG